MLVRDFDLEKTLNCGQVFHWQEIGGAYFGTIGSLPVRLEQTRNRLIIDAPGELDGFKPSSRGAREERKQIVTVVRNYLARDHPLGDICRSFPRDPALGAATKFCRGLHIIRQPRWECLATFICSSMKQVAHIRQISLALRKRFGTEKIICGNRVYDFPGAERLGKSSERELRQCALGYRAKNLLATARLVATGKADLDEWSKLPDEELRQRLCELPGVGAKVANCVMLFAYERLRAFPIDVWIARVLREQYFPRRRKVTPQQLREFCGRYFGEHGGYAQQYLFHHARMSRRERQGC